MRDNQEGSGHSPPPDPSLESTASLLKRLRAGDSSARDRLLTRYLPAMKRWAHGRLPDRARDLLDTDDLVQITLIRALDKLESFEPRRDGAFLAYLRQILMNRIRDEARRVRREPGREELPDELLAPGPSPLERTLGKERLEGYESALGSLPEKQQEAIIMRVELGFSYKEIAKAVGSPSSNAARMAVARALARLAEALGENVDA